MLRLYGDNGKAHGDYYAIIGIIYWGCMGIMEKLESTMI